MHNPPRDFQSRPQRVKAMLFAAYTEGLGPAEWNNNIGGDVWQWLRSFGASFRMTQEHTGPAYMLLRTRDGLARVDVGCWIVRTTHRTTPQDFEVYSPEAFHRLFEPAETGEHT